MEMDEAAGQDLAGQEQAAPSTLLGEQAAEAKPQGMAQEGGNQPVAEAGAQSSPGAEPGALVPGNPEGYQLSLPEGTVVDEALLGGFKNLAHEQGLNQAQAQALSTMYARHVQASETRYRESMRAWEQENRSQIEARADFASAKGDAQRFLVQYGTPELIKALNETLMGSHPALFEVFAKAGKALGEPGFKRGQGGQAEKPLRDRLWPDMK